MRVVCRLQQYQPENHKEDVIIILKLVMLMGAIEKKEGIKVRIKQV